MEIMKNYSDLITEIEIIKDQIKLTERELEYWSGITPNGEKNDGIPLASKGAHKYGTEAALTQTEKKLKSLSRLQERLEYHEKAKERLDYLIKRLKGLDYRIAYKKIVELKTHQEIADELGYSHDYIRERWSALKKNTHNVPTETLVKI